MRTHFVSQLLENDPELARKFYINVGCKLATLLDNLSRISKEKETTPKKKGLPVLVRFNSNLQIYQLFFDFVTQAIESNEKQVLDKEFLSRFALTNQLLLKRICFQPPPSTTQFINSFISRISMLLGESCDKERNILYFSKLCLFLCESVYTLNKSEFKSSNLK